MENRKSRLSSEKKSNKKKIQYSPVDSSTVEDSLGHTNNVRPNNIGHQFELISKEKEKSPKEIEKEKDQQFKVEHIGAMTFSQSPYLNRNQQQVDPVQIQVINNDVQMKKDTTLPNKIIYTESHMPIMIKCFQCGFDGMTKAEVSDGPAVWMTCFTCCLFGCFLCAPCAFCMDGLKDVHHYCGNCKSIVAIKKPCH